MRIPILDGKKVMCLFERLRRQRVADWDPIGCDAACCYSKNCVPMSPRDNVFGELGDFRQTKFRMQEKIDSRLNESSSESKNLLIGIIMDEIHPVVLARIEF